MLLLINCNDKIHFLNKIDIKVVYLRQYMTLSPDGRDNKVMFYISKKSYKIKIKDATL